MNLQTYTCEQLHNGLTLVCSPMASVRSVSMGLYLRIGSRYEQAEESGISHFLEHMLFKGCAGWPTALEIANEIEGRGGYLNAATGQEFTSFWIKIGARHWRQALALMAAMIQSPVLNPAEFERERSVILDEINMYRDVPEDYVSQLSGQALWGAHALGREIAGNLETVSALSVEAVRDYHHRAYRPDQAVLSVAGAIDAAEVQAAALEVFQDWSPNGVALEYEPAPAAEPRPRLLAQIRPSEQSHLQLALPGLSRDHPDRFAIGLLNALVGDSMSSRLWQRLREEMGLAYNIGSYVSLYADSGALGVYGGCDARRLFETLDGTMQVWQDLQQQAISAAELQQFKEYMKGRLELSSEDSSSVAAWWGRQIAAFTEPLTLDQVLAHIDDISPQDIQRLAQTLWNPRFLTLAYVGPLEEDERLDAWLHKYAPLP